MMSNTSIVLPGKGQGRVGYSFLNELELRRYLKASIDFPPKKNIITKRKKRIRQCKDEMPYTKIIIVQSFLSE